jgi:hypothetical protein
LQYWPTTTAHRTSSLWDVQGGDDDLAAFTHNSKAALALRTALDSAGLTDPQRVVAKALYALDGLGPKDVCALAKRFGSFAGLMRHFAGAPAAAACAEVATVKREGGRNVGPAAAKKLHHFLTCEDPDAAML